MAGGPRVGAKTQRSGPSPSFADILKENIIYNGSRDGGVEKRVEVVKWDGETADASWLQHCTVGVLKSFSDFSLVVRMLGSRNLYPSTRYLGDKNVLWEFLSAKDRDSFIRNRFIWEDFFLSMGLECPDSIKIVTGKSSFSISSREVHRQVDLGWISNKLGMNMGDQLSDCYQSLREECNQILETVPVPGFTKSCNRQNKGEVGGKGKSNQDRDRGIGSPRIADSKSKRWGAVKEPLVKGKNVLIRTKAGKPPSNFASNASINLESRQDRRKKVWDSEYSGFSSTDGEVEALEMPPPNFVGQLSLGPFELRGNFYIDLGSGPGEDSRMGLISRGPVFTGEDVPLVDAERGNSAVETQIEHLDHNPVLSNDNLTTSSVEGEVGNFPDVEETELAEVETQARKDFTHMKGASRVSTFSKVHRMKTRKDATVNSVIVQSSDRTEGYKSNVFERWNLEIEVTKIIEKGVELGHIIPTSATGDRKITREGSREQTGSWNLSQEVAKVIEMGLALGFDYDGEELVVGNEVARRVIEDEDNLKTIKKKSKGLGRAEKRRVVRRLVMLHKPTMLFIQESKLNYFDNMVIKAFGGFMLTRGIGVESRGSAGGLITLWDGDLFEAQACISNDRCIIVSGMLLRLKKYVVFCNVYAANKEPERKDLWSFILNAQDSFPVPWVVGGDFNTVLEPCERKGGMGCTISMRNFQNFIDLAKFRSSGNSGRQLLLKSKAVKKYMKSRVKEKSQAGGQSKELEEDLMLVERKVESQRWTPGLRQDRLDCLVKLWKSIKVEEQRWRQTSRVKWIKEGDRNSRSRMLRGKS
ncbi:hypothetical protein Dsin_023090 [Dipteronia sinensis]|uniref:Endonuclease/exonuclease/phosphatase domain-containing protein n=1 Tax=Dipteronia sinensis TaxID=43782 RepID=A0AAE0E0C7_9ROSI|nr:hypothetical protein Dsin_023090 [Dipteronia sinensis]